MGVLLLVTYFVLQLFALRFRGRSDLRFPERMVVAITAPVQYSFDATVGWVGGLFRHYIFLTRTSELNDALKKERDRLHAQLAAMEEVRQENHRLRTLLELEPAFELKLLVAERFATGQSPFERTIRIDRGTEDGLKEGMAVLHPRGVVGQVMNVFGSTSDVLLLIDRISAVDVINQRSRARGILQGHAFDKLRFEYLPRESDVEVGDQIVTSGLDGVYPKGIPVGTVIEVGEETQSLFKSAAVRPYVDYLRLEEVAVVLDAETRKELQP